MWIAAPAICLYSVYLNGTLVSAVEADSIKGYVIIHEWDSSWEESLYGRGKTPYKKHKAYGNVSIEQAPFREPDAPSAVNFKLNLAGASYSSPGQSCTVVRKT